MKLVDMTNYGEGVGDCFTACVASIMGLPVGEVLDATSLHQQCGEDESGAFWAGWMEWLKQHGITVGFSETEVGGLCIACGKSPRPDRHHAVLWDGGMIHDPHKSRDGIIGAPTYFVYLNLPQLRCWENGVAA